MGTIQLSRSFCRDVVDMTPIGTLTNVDVGPARGSLTRPRPARRMLETPA
jgi:hypothetical protein